MKGRQSGVDRIRVSRQSANLNAPQNETVPSRRADAEMVRRLRDGDEATFEALVQLHHRTMVRVARSMGATEAVAEEIAQDTWRGFIEGLGSFEGRCSVRTWLFRILMNRTRTGDAREKRSVSLDGLSESRADGEVLATVTGSLALLDSQTPERLVGNTQLVKALEVALETLPAAQRTVLCMRDIAELDAEEVSRVLKISEANQRVLLHRARSRLRTMLAPFWRCG